MIKADWKKMDLKQLEKAYLSTEYRVYLEKKRKEPYIVITVGQFNEQWEKNLRSLNVESWAIVTGDNPRSKICSEKKNKEQQKKLEEYIIEGKKQQKIHSYLLAENVDSYHQWPSELAFCVVGIEKKEALHLGSVFEQLAIVGGHVGGKAELWWCSF